MAQRLKQDGSVLILTVWTLFFLAALAVATASYVSGGLMVARQSASGAHGRFAAMSGLESAVAVIAADTNDWDAFSEDWGYMSDVQWEERKSGEGVYSVYHVTSGGVTNPGVVDEESRININQADRALLEALFKVIGRVDSVQASALASAVIDWRDPDDDVSEGGAESGYYAGLNPGYECANEDFQAVLELMLVRGMTYDVFVRIQGFITVFGEGKLNINTAEAIVIQVVAQAVGADEGVAVDLAEKIVSGRQAGLCFSDSNAFAIAEALKGAGMLRAEDQSVLLRMMTHMTLRGTCFRGISEGRRGDSLNSVVLEFVYSREKGRILYWNEQ